MLAIRLDPHSARTLWRLGFRFVVIVGFAVLWPGPSVAAAIATLCLALAAGCLVAAVAFRQPLRDAGLTHWHEAAALLIIACLLLVIR